MSSTSSGMATSGSSLTSWRMSSIGKSGARSSGPTGSPVPGCSTGCGGLGMSARMLYQRLGSSDSASRYFVCSMAPSLRLGLRSLQGLGHGLRACRGVGFQLELRALHFERDDVAEEQALDLDRVDVRDRDGAQDLFDRAALAHAERLAGLHREQAFLG